MSDGIRVLIWNEHVHESNPNHLAAEVYPEGIHGALAAHLGAQPGLTVRTATLREPEHGLTEAVLAETDVIVWWSHAAQGELADAVADRVIKRILSGTGLVCLHSGCGSKVYTRLMGQSCLMRWREYGEKERIWNINPGHPIAAGIGQHFDLAETEMYGEPWDAPAPEALVFLSWFAGGDVFRSGACYTRGLGRIFYFRPGHETHPIYRDPNVQRVITNACRWAAPSPDRHLDPLGNVPPLEDIPKRS